MIVKLLANRFGYQNAVNELKEEWLEELLMFLGIDVRGIQEVGSPLFLEYLLENSIDIVEYPKLGALSVEFEGEIVGEWAGPELTLKKDETGELYYEIKIEHWSIIEENIEFS